MLQDFLSLIDKLDNPYTFGIALILAVLALLWRYLDRRFQGAADRSNEIAAAIGTRDGSHLDEAIDKLTAHSYIQLELWSKTDKRVLHTAQEVQSIMNDWSTELEWVRAKMQEEALAASATTFAEN